MNNVELLDYFAGRVLNAMIISCDKLDLIENVKNKSLESISYEIASNMLEERKKYTYENAIQTPKQV